MLKERQKDFLENNGFKLTPANEYELKLEDENIQFLWSIPHQVGCAYSNGVSEIMYDFDQLAELLELIV